MLRAMAKPPKRSRRARVATAPPLVAVIDDDVSVRESLPDLLKSLGFDANGYASARDFLNSGCVGATRCLLLDVALPDMSGPELQHELVQSGRAIPIVFITAHVDEMIRQRLLKQSAIECLFKPFSEQQLRAALDAAFRSR
jgi:FixJ family two-component response regulator